MLAKMLLAFVAAIASPVLAQSLLPCVQSIDRNVRRCKSASSLAKSQADQWSTVSAKTVAGQSLKHAADLEKALTAQIASLYQVADDACSKARNSCGNKCQAQNQPFARECEGALDRVAEEIRMGKAEALRSFGLSNQSSLQASGFANENAQRHLPSAAAAALESPGSTSSSPNLAAQHSNILQPPVEGESNIGFQKPVAANNSTLLQKPSSTSVNNSNATSHSTVNSSTKSGFKLPPPTVDKRSIGAFRDLGRLKGAIEAPKEVGRAPANVSIGAAAGQLVRTVAGSRNGGPELPVFPDGITPSNGPTIFEKVSRQYQRLFIE